MHSMFFIIISRISNWICCRIGRTLTTTGQNPGAKIVGLATINPGVENLPPTFKTDVANK